MLGALSVEADVGLATRTSVTFSKAGNGLSKQRASLSEALVASGLKDGGTVSFQHHLRNGDGVLNLVIAEAAALGRRDLTVAASSLFPVHAPLVEHIRQGVVTGIRFWACSRCRVPLSSGPSYGHADPWRQSSGHQPESCASMSLSSLRQWPTRLAT